jgi:hypothetical protein
MLEAGMDVASPNSAQFAVAYDGEALKDHTIDVRDLAPALLGISDAFDAANKCINGDRASVSVTVKANREGSFVIDFHLVQALTLARQVTSFLSGDKVTAAANLAGILGFCGISGVGVIGLIKAIRGRKATKTDIGGGKVRIELPGETAIEILKEVATLYENSDVRRGLERTLKPLRQDGIDTFKIMQGKEAIETISKDEIALFNEPTVVNPVEHFISEPQKRVLQIISPVFGREMNKWRLFDGGNNIYATVLDAEFLASIHAGRAFAEGDSLVCDVVTNQVISADGTLRLTHEIVKVHEHRPRPTQLPFQFDESKT